VVGRVPGLPNVLMADVSVLKRTSYKLLGLRLLLNFAVWDCSITLYGIYPLVSGFRRYLSVGWSVEKVHRDHGRFQKGWRYGLAA